MSAEGFEPRPKTNAGAKYPYERIIETASNGQAVRLIGETARRGTVVSSITDTLARRGYRVHSTADGADLLVWCERIVAP